MRILHVTSNSYPNIVGGEGVYTYSLCKQLKARHEILVFTSHLQSETKILIKRTKINHINYISVNRLKIVTGFNRFDLVYRHGIYINKKVDYVFERLIKKFRPDIIHFHGLMSLSVNLISIAYRLKIPIIFTLHDHWLLCHRLFLIDNHLNFCKERCSFKRSLECYLKLRLNMSVLINELAKQSRLDKKFTFLVDWLLAGLTSCYEYLYLKFWVMKEVIRNVNLFIFPSHYLLTKFAQCNFPRRKLIHLESGINISILENRKAITSAALRFGFIASMITLLKGIKVLLEAFSSIENAQLHIYGKPPLVSERKEILKFSNNENIKFYDEFDYSDIGKVFSDIDVLVVPSICVENSPLVIKEAFAARVPVIASRIGGIPELIRDDENGLLFNPGDVNELRSKIQYLIDNPQEIEKMRERIPPVKSIEEHAKEIEEIYARLIKYNKA